MTLYSQSQVGSSSTQLSPAWSALAASTDNPKLMEICITVGNGTATNVGLGRPGNDGSFVQTAGLAVLPENPADPAGTTTTAIAWGTAPTQPVNFYRRVNIPAAIGGGIIWTFIHGLVMPASHGLTVWNFYGTGAISTSIHIVVDE